MLKNYMQGLRFTLSNDSYKLQIVKMMHHMAVFHQQLISYSLSWTIYILVILDHRFLTYG